MSRNIIKMLVLLCLITAPFLVQTVLAVPANGEPVDYVQPEGDIIKLYTYGDEHYNFVGDENGYLLRKNASGKYEYVTSGVSTFRFSPSENGRPANAVKGFDLAPENKAVNKVLTTKVSALETPLKVKKTFNSAQDEPANEKINKLLVIAVDFQNIKLDTQNHSSQKINDMFFSSDEDTLSVYNYFEEVSGGRQFFVPAFTLDKGETYSGDYGRVADGVIKVLVEGNHPSPQSLTSAEDKAIAIESIIRNAIEKADPFIDFSEYNFDKRIDLISGNQFLFNDELTICFLVAGYEGSTGNNTLNSVWAHKSNLYDPDFVFDGVLLLPCALLNENNQFEELYGDYVMCGAMHDVNNPMGIGSFCHELAHTLGLPDLYNTENQNSDYGDIYTLSLMSHGNWCCADENLISSTMPSHIDPWSKYFMGWYGDDEILEIEYSDKVGVDLQHYMYENPGYKLVKVNTADPNEYYLIENRAFEGYDKGLNHNSLSNPGIAIWRIDEEVLNEVIGYAEITNGETNEVLGVIEYTNLDLNQVNCTSTPGVKLLRSGKGLADFYASKSPLWYKGAGKMPCFNSVSFPSNSLNTSYNGNADSGVKIDFLSESGSVMKVDFGKSALKAVYMQNLANTKFFVFNDTADSAKYMAASASYTVDGLDDLYILGKLNVPSDSFIAESYTDPLFSDPDSKFFIWNMNTLAPVIK